uniref:Acyl-coenzyme A thioesterase THEM4 n=1 Tax=Lotharella globosa TaxID=91324 RepID=A0A7S3YQK1_9EUKA
MFAKVENRPWASASNRSSTGCVGEDFVKYHDLVPMVFLWSPSRKLLTGTAKFGPLVEGPKLRAHGASIAMVFDEILAYPVWREIDEKYGMGVTAKLSVSYKAALPLKSTAKFECRVVKKEGRKWFVTAEITDMKGETVYATGEALFISVPLPDMGRKHFLCSKL